MGTAPIPDGPESTAETTTQKSGVPSVREIRDGKEYEVTKLPDDWRLSARATKERTLWQAADHEGRKQEKRRKRIAKWKRRQRKR